MYANGIARDTAIDAIESIYPIGSGARRKITRQEIEDAYDGAHKLGLSTVGRDPQWTQPQPHACQLNQPSRQLNRFSMTAVARSCHQSGRESWPMHTFAMFWVSEMMNILG